ncbi:MAG: transposase [Candidatus Sumerlaeia bacterium]|nr:transposase [Candidatus Sumerlaeia bacterium]
MTKTKQQRVKRIKLDFAPHESVTSFGGFAVIKRLILRLGIDGLLEKHLPTRRGYSLPEIACSAVAGLLSGARGTVATEAVRHDPALRRLLGLSGSPEEATFWRSLGDAGAPKALAGFDDIYGKVARRAILRSSRTALFDHGFVPVFIDGTLLEGSERREGTKVLKEKGKGLLWTAGFVGPFPCAQRLAAKGKGEGEVTHARQLLERIDHDILLPTGLKKDALVLMDSLHGNGPTLDLIEERGLDFIIGARGLSRVQDVLSEQHESQWTPSPEYDAKHPGIEESAVCVASVHCEDWKHKRMIIGRRWRKKGEFVWNYTAVLTSLREDDPRLGACENHGKFAKKIWNLYNRKGAHENHFKNLLADLGLHHPPCQEWIRNAGFYAIGLLGGLIGMTCDVLTSKPSKARRRLATLRRWLLAVPARVTCHGRTAVATVLGLSDWWRSWSADRFARAARC